MRLRHVFLITLAIGACAALMLALDFYQRLKAAERALYLSHQAPGVDSILYFGSSYAIGLLALAFLFIALLLMLLTLLRNKNFASRLECSKQAISENPPLAATIAPAPLPLTNQSENT